MPSSKDIWVSGYLEISRCGHQQSGLGTLGGERLPPCLTSAWLPRPTTQETNVIDEIATSSGGSLASMYSSTLPMAERATPMYFAESYTNFRLWAPGLRASG